MMSALLRRWRGEPVVPAPRNHAAARTHVGHVRRVNEDRLLERTDRGLWAVADGMGGHSAGDIAATWATDALAALADAPVAITPDTVIDRLRDAHDAIRGREFTGGMSGTTIVALHLDAGQARIFWAGDSRAYRIRGGEAEQLTVDHSMVQEMVDAGAITPDQARHHPQGNVITRALGVEIDPGVETRTVDVQSGDLFLLCSDGLSRSLDLQGIDTLERLDLIADRLLTAALALDGSDNISLVLVRIA